jgi:hypothetical protein
MISFYSKTILVDIKMISQVLSSNSRKKGVFVSLGEINKVKEAGK